MARFRNTAFGLASPASSPSWSDLTSAQWSVMSVEDWNHLPVMDSGGPFGFGGQSGYYFDPETNLYLLGGGGHGRYYDPQLARFQNADPTGIASGDANLYRYVANDPVNRRDPSGNQDDRHHVIGQVNSANKGVTISDVLAAYHLAYPSDSLFAQAAEAAVQITEGENWYWNWNYFPNGSSYEDNDGKTKTVDLIRFDRDYLKSVDLNEAVENLRTALIKLRDDPSSKMARVATRWDGNVEDFLKFVTGNLKVLSAGTRPYELQGSAVEAMNEGIVSALEFMPYAGGLILIGQLASGRKLSFTVYGQRDLSTTEKVVIVGGAAASFIVPVLVWKGGKWVVSKISDEFSSLISATKHMDEIAPESTVRRDINEAVEEAVDAAEGVSKTKKQRPVDPGGGSNVDKPNRIDNNASGNFAPNGLPPGFDPAKGFASFDDFKKAFGAAGEGQAWHHVVEQTINSGKFAPELLHNPANLIRLPHGKGTIHAKISGYYSSKPAWTGGLTVREWISQKSFAEQFEFGIKTIKQFGGTQYLPTHLQ